MNEKDKEIDEKLENLYKKSMGTIIKLKEENKRLKEENEILRKENENLKNIIKNLETRITQILENLEILEGEE
ncbi:MAG: hypothetical protein ABIL37_00715 [candidate division WOR-3 bacterium]